MRALFLPYNPIAFRNCRVYIFWTQNYFSFSTQPFLNFTSIKTQSDVKVCTNRLILTISNLKNERKNRNVTRQKSQKNKKKNNNCVAIYIRKNNSSLGYLYQNKPRLIQYHIDYFEISRLVSFKS